VLLCAPNSPRELFRGELVLVRVLGAAINVNPERIKVGAAGRTHKTRIQNNLAFPFAELRQIEGLRAGITANPNWIKWQWIAARERSSAFTSESVSVAELRTRDGVEDGAALAGVGMAD
jgi:hypothetical protein